MEYQWTILKEGADPEENENNENEAVEGEGDSVSSVESGADLDPVIEAIEETQKLQYAELFVISLIAAYLIIRSFFNHD